MKCLPISNWLTQLGLAEYCTLFERYDGIEDLFHLTEVDLRKLGIENQGHRTHLISNILLLQEVKQKREPKMIAAGKFSSLPRNGPVNHQFSLASSMDLLTTKPSPAEHRSNSFQGVSIHGTLPRKKKGIVSSRSCDMFSHVGTLPYTRARQQPPFVQDVIEEYPPENGKSSQLHARDQNILDPTLEYVKFSRERQVMDNSPEKLKKELEEELQLSSEDLRSHAWYHGRIPRQVAEGLVQRDGDFLIRDSLSSPGNFVLTCQWKNSPQHFKIDKTVLRLNEAYCRVQYQFELESFDTIPGLVRYYVGNRTPISKQSGAIIFQPINRTVPLRCLEEKYGVTPVQQKEPSTPEGKTETAKRLSLGISSMQSPEQSIPRGNLLRNKEKSGSQPASLDHVVEKRFPLKAHQSESYLLIGSRHPSQLPEADTISCPSSPAFRTGSEPSLSPTVVQKVTSESQLGEALRGSDSQLCPKPPPKPSKAPLMKPPDSPLASHCSEGHYWELNPTRHPTAATQHLCQKNSYVEHLTQKERATFRNSETSYLILDDDPIMIPADPLEASTQMAEEDSMFSAPVYETVSSFKPNDFESKLLPPENKPLETSMLRKVKELFTNNNPKIIAQHILRMDCKVARIVEVSEEMRRNMGGTSGLELITLPYGHQLRLDLIERHNTMAIGIAVDILGCTGNVEDRAAALNRIIQVAVELKESLGDLYGFSAIMKALEMPQVSRLEQTWTALRHCYTQTAIMYEKQLKPACKALHEGQDEWTKTISAPQNIITVPLLMPLVTLMERQAVVFEGMELWESSDQSGEIMLRHLGTARLMAQHAETFRLTAERLLQGFQPDEELSEIFKTEFQMRLLWGSKGAQVNQSERYEKFSRILTALSRKLEPPPVKLVEQLSI
ncbi:breast cancer anti-estrogen resistance protein 3 isoform X1 [Hirundo rustica]|uniref:breast cancer anti-estrogen resistance protein 3 isoform X1 n=2 Tax=Hirundo rustica TaxID=43150 RepID=UPI001A93EDDB|nr:breast cancer anti-estrogen resistance protein 3 isoform X1 [Hirundo rustica]XP_039928755.1 breast cancer anti-estrogen resistance protein 3 isoform X1 [Hirundo rustica]XP_039928756.1 breast cancer anti-estrogen resistance protein 3 isoform X1 [Hirundo rustica]XP_039928758.1 breast cancer anti-estrogen resistance protein 3 isoform X1 [Hirundo rustica]